MTHQEREKFEKELTELRERFDPAKWQGQPKEMLKAFEEVGYRHEGDVSKKIRDAKESYLDSRDASLTHGERATLALNATDGQRERRLADLKNDPVWCNTQVIIQNEHDHNYQQVWRQMDSVRRETARANGIDVDKAYDEMRREDQANTRAKVGMASARPPQNLSVEDAMERRNKRVGLNDYEPEM